MNNTWNAFAKSIPLTKKTQKSIEILSLSTIFSYSQQTHS